MLLISGIILLIAVVGALPFGLVNLSVLNTAFHRDRKSAMKVAHGAAWIEVLYGLTALLTGTILANAINDKPFIKFIVILLPIFIGLFFLFRNNHSKQNPLQKEQGLLKGIILNLLSVQVLLYWVIAITWLKNSYLININLLIMVLFIASVWTGKMSVLWLYAQYSKFIMSKSDFFAKNINRIIGIVLIISGIIQLIK